MYKVYKSSELVTLLPSRPLLCAILTLMTFEVTIGRQNLSVLMRRAGYAPDPWNSHEKNPSFLRPLARAGYPRFHIYATLTEGDASARLNLHLDQKKASYEGSGAHAHSGEYDGALVENEARRIHETFRLELGLG